MRALFCLCGPQPCQIDESRTLQTPPTWASSHHGWLSRTLLTTAEAGFPTVHLEKTLDLQTQDQGQSGPKNWTLHPQGRRLRARGVQEGLSGNGAVGPGGSPDGV